MILSYTILPSFLHLSRPTRSASSRATHSYPVYFREKQSLHWELSDHSALCQVLSLWWQAILCEGPLVERVCFSHSFLLQCTPYVTALSLWVNWHMTILTPCNLIRSHLVLQLHRLMKHWSSTCLKFWESIWVVYDCRLNFLTLDTPYLYLSIKLQVIALE